MKLRDLVGAIKDKASQGKAAILSRQNTLSLLRATTHDPHAPPNPKYLAAVLSLGHSSRAAASAFVETLMDRLQSTGDAYVALKCLVAAHHMANRGSFILQDQLSVFPTYGGRNYLNLSKFRDSSSHVTWQLSTWVRWYGEYVENLLVASRVLGFFLGAEKLGGDSGEERISAISNAELIREMESLVGLLEQICKQPEILVASGNKLVHEIVGLVGDDSLSAINEISVRVTEFGERLSCLSFVDSVELACALKRAEDCKERLQLLYFAKKDMNEGFWSVVGEIKERVWMETEAKEGKLVVNIRTDKGTESARFGERVVRPGDSVRFGSGRLAVSYCRFSNEPMAPCA